jgi:hypothetical protein
MDEFENRLKRDAEEIRAEVSPELKSRIDASLRATEQIRPVPESRTTGMNIWWASSLTGLAAAIAIIVLINWNQPATAPVTVKPVATHTVPVMPDESADLNPPLLFKTADFASPLEEEMIRLQADIEKARQSVKNDIDFTF